MFRMANLSRKNLWAKLIFKRKKIFLNTQFRKKNTTTHALLFAVFFLPCFLLNESNKTFAEKEQQTIFRKAEVEQHSSIESRVWIIYKDGVYDITDFIPNHPGGEDKIKLAAGKSVEPFWAIYRQHYNSKLPMELLLPMRIGTLHPDDIDQSTALKDASDPYCEDPALSPIFAVHQNKPINAEAPGALLTDSWLTPADLWFVRNHHPVPVIPDGEAHPLALRHPQASEPVTFTVRELKSNFPKHKVVASLECGGNRRKELNQLALTSGSPWDVGAISTAEWGGARLADVLAAAGCPLLSTSGMHLVFESADGLEASVPAATLLRPVGRGDVLLAYEMNGQPLPPAHGYPLRVIVPGHVGVRNVKWVNSVRLSEHEAEGPWQRGMAYKGFGPSTTSTKGIDVARLPSVQEMPVTSAITVPQAGAVLEAGSVQTVRGYAYSGGGRGIVRVDVSADGGETWSSASLLEGSDQPLDSAWAWTLWECELPVPERTGDTLLVCKAVDAAHNCQPDGLRGVWNLRGILNNAWHRVPASVAAPEEEA